MANLFHYLPRKGTTVFKKNQSVEVARRNGQTMQGKIIHVEPNAGRGEWYTVRSHDKMLTLKVRAGQLQLRAA